MSPHTISDEALDEFIVIYKKEYRKKLTREEARVMAARLLRLYGLLIRRPAGNTAHEGVSSSEEKDSHA